MLVAAGSAELRTVAVRQVSAAQGGGSGGRCQAGLASGDGITAVSELTAHLDLPAGFDALAAARQVTKAALTGWGLGDREWVDDAVLVADELVANAVRHGGGFLRLQIHARDGRVTIAAVDGSAVVPRRRDPDGDGGRGLAIIEALCDEWGVTNLDDGHKCVWVRLAPPPVGV